MPLERISKSFKDISLTFKSNPVNSDILALKNAQAIARSVRNLISTFPGEKFFNEEIGSDITRVTFEQFDTLTSTEIRDQIETTLTRFEPRIKLDTVEVSNDYGNLEFNVTVKYSIIGLDIEPQSIEFALQPNR
jgi:phage baseplate assembly protein W